MRLSARGDAVPVLDALRLVGDHELGCPGIDQVRVTGQRFVVGDLAEGVFAVLQLALRAQAVNHLHFAFGEAREFVLPLMLERRRAYHQDALNTEVAREQLGRGDGLDGLAQAHLVADQRAAGARGEQRAFGLVRVELDFQELGKRLVIPIFRVGLGQGGMPALAIADLRDELPDLVVSAQFVALSFAMRINASSPPRRSRCRAQPAVASNSCSARAGRAGGQPVPARKWT